MGLTYPHQGNPSVSVNGGGTNLGLQAAVYGTAAEWAAANPILGKGELGHETDTGVYKAGDGSTAWASLTTTGSSTYARSRFNGLPTLRLNSATLSKWAIAVAAARAGSRDAKVLFCGDSTMIGVFGATTASVPDWGSPVAFATAYLNDEYMPTVHGLGIPPSSVTNTDTRWATGTGWGKTNLQYVGFGGKSCGYTANNPAGALVYSDARIYADTFDVYVVGNNVNNLGTVTATATGGSGVALNTGTQAAIGIYKITCTAASADWNNSVSIAATGAKAVYIIGVEPRLSTGTGRIRVANGGASGTTSTDWTTFQGTSADAYESRAFIRAYAPDLTVICIQINDAGAAFSTSTHVTNYTALITAAQVSGDVLLVSCPPSSSSGTYQTWEPQYTTIEKSTFTTCAYADYGAAADSYTRQNALARMYDGLHPNAAGYEHYGRAMAAAIGRIAP